MSTRDISWEGKGDRCVGLNLRPSCADLLEIWKPQPPGILRKTGNPETGLSRPVSGLLFTSTLRPWIPRQRIYTVQKLNIMNVTPDSRKNVECIRQGYKNLYLSKI
jgi:hypothetical protein